MLYILYTRGRGHARTGRREKTVKTQSMNVIVKCVHLIVIRNYLVSEPYKLDIVIYASILNIIMCVIWAQYVISASLIMCVP